MDGSAHAIEVAEEVVLVLRGKRKGPAALATVTATRGSAPQIVGAKLLMRSDQTLVGTVGGGAIEAKVLDACRSSLRDGRSRTVSANLVRDLAMCCGGTMEVFVEYVQPALRLFILGGGHVSQAIAPIAKAAGFRVAVLDDREDILDNPSFEGVETQEHDVDDLPEALADLTAEDFVLIVTRGPCPRRARTRSTHRPSPPLHRNDRKSAKGAHRRGAHQTTQRSARGSRPRHDTCPCPDGARARWENAWRDRRERGRRVDRGAPRGVGVGDEHRFGSGRLCPPWRRLSPRVSSRLVYRH